jgi:hypothetical protein
MGLLDSLKNAQEQGRQAARRSVERVGEMWEDAERRIRRKMRVHPRPSDVRATSASSAAAGDIHKPAA